MTQYAFSLDESRCTNCKTCVVACRDKNDISVGYSLRNAYRICGGDTVRDSDNAITSTCFAYSVSIACNHCDNPACLPACPQAAITKDEDTGAVLRDIDKCIGCGTCALTCPYGAPKVDEELKKAIRCDMCVDRVKAGEQPVCVTACPTRALNFGPVEDVSATGERLNVAPFVLPDETGPNFFVMGGMDAKPASSSDAMIENEAEIF